MARSTRTHSKVDAGLYVRVSSSEQVGYSLADQERTLRQYCEAMQWNVLEVFRDEGISGKSVRRPGLQRMIQSVKDGTVKKVVTLKLDRLSRNSRDLLNLTDELEECGVSISYVKDQIDTSTAAGKMLRTIMAAMAQFESDVARERTLSAKAEVSKQGKFAGGNIPYGYDYDRTNQQFYSNETEAKIVTRIFNEFLGGKSAYAIASKLGEDGIVSKYGGTWQANQVLKILRNRFYVGELSWQRITTPNHHLAIVDLKKFKNVQKKINAKRQKRKTTPCT